VVLEECLHTPQQPTLKDILPQAGSPLCTHSSNTEPFDVQFVKLVAFQLAECLDKLHNDLGFVHRNLTFENVFVKQNGTLEVSNFF
jgi:hypothetical protein